MRYLLFFLLFFSVNLFAQTPQPTCSVTGTKSLSQDRNLQSLSNTCLSNQSPTNTKYFRTYGPGPDAGSYPTTYFSCDSQCTCPEGSSWYTGVDTSGNPTSGCSPDDGGDTGENQCDGSGQVFYEGFCRDAVASPSDCGSTYTTAINVGGSYVCSNNGCASGQTQSVYTSPAGSWNVCGGEGDGSGNASSGANTSGSNTSTGSNTSAPSSTGSNTSGDSNTSSGSGSGNGTGAGTGDGSGSTSSSSTNPGSGSTSSGIGNGGEADAANCDNGEPHCDGDPIQCAILVQLWINNCAGYDQVQTNNPDNDNEAIESSFVALISSAEPSVNAEGVLTAMTPGGGAGNGSGSGSGSGTGSGNGGGSGLDLSGLDGAAGSGAGGSCPPDRAISLEAGNFNISFQFFCDFASQISGLVVLIFSYIGGMIVYRSLNW